MNQELLKGFKESPYVGVVKEYFEEQITKMCDISTHTSWEEVLGKQYASKILRDMIKLLETKPEKEKIPNQYK